MESTKLTDYLLKTSDPPPLHVAKTNTLKPICHQSTRLLNATRLLNNEKDELLLQKKNSEVTKPTETKDTKKTSKNTMKTHPDGGWGWVVVIAAFLTQFIVVGLQNSSGVIFNELVKKFDRPRGQTGFVSSISCGMMFILGPITTSLCQKFGCRTVSICGGFLCSLGMFASAYASSLEVMYVTFGFTWGLGTSFCYFPTLIILVPYFDKRLALVNGIVSSGSGIGTLILSPFLSFFADKYGVKNMFFMLSALHGIVFFASFVYRPISDHYRELQGLHVKDKKSKEDESIPERQYTQETLLSINSRNDIHQNMNKYNNNENNNKQIENEKERVKKLQHLVLYSLFQDKAFVAWCLGLSVFMLGYFVPFVHLVRYAKLIGISEVRAAFLISILSVVATVCKVLSGKLAGLKNVDTFKMYQFGLLLMGVATTLLPISHSYIGLVVYAVVFGISESCFIVMIPLITKDIVGVRRLPLALGCVFMLMGIPTVVGAPIAGWIYDAFHDYSYAFYVAGSMNTFGVLIMFFVVLFREDKNQTKTTFPTIHIDIATDNLKAIDQKPFHSHLDLLELDIYYEHYNDENTDHLEYIYGCVTTPTISRRHGNREHNKQILNTIEEGLYRPESPSIHL